MGKQIGGVAVTGVVLFVFGFLYWGLSPLPYMAWNDSDPAAMEATLKTAFPEDGVYGFPGPGAEASIRGMVYVMHDVGAQPDPVSMILGLIHSFVTAVLVLFVIRNQEGTAACVKAGAITGLVAVVVIEGSDLVWWLYPLAWKIHGAIYHLLLFVIAAAVLSKFLPGLRAAS